MRFVFYDEAGAVVGEYEDFVGCTGHGYDYFAEGVCPAPFARVEITVDFSDLQRSTHCMDGVAVRTDETDETLFVTLENTGVKAVSSCSYAVVFFDENGQAVDCRSGYWDIPDTELQPGQTATVECGLGGMAFAAYEVYCNAVNFGN